MRLSNICFAALTMLGHGIRALYALTIVAAISGCYASRPFVNPFVPQQSAAQDKVPNDPNYREKATPAWFPNKAIPPKWPEAKPQTHGLDLTRRDWETSKKYFDWLCANEAGEFIYKVVENVEGIFEMRRRPGYAHDWRVHDRYYLEDPWGWPPTSNSLEEIYSPYSFVMPSTMHGNVADAGDKWWKGGGYFRYYPEQSYPVLEVVSSPLERKRYGEGSFIRYTRTWPSHPEYDRDKEGRIRMYQHRKHLGPRLDVLADGTRYFDNIAYESPNRLHFDEEKKRVGILTPKVEAVNDIRSRYGFTWRGIERSPHDRDLGIGGGEIVVFDLYTNEVLGFRRNFRLTRPYKGTNRVDWLMGPQCLKFEIKPLFKKILKPVDPYKDRQITNGVEVSK